MTSVKICSHPYFLYKTLDLTSDSIWNCNMCDENKLNKDIRYRCKKKNFDICIDCCEIYGKKKLYSLKMINKNMKNMKNKKDTKSIFNSRKKIKKIIYDASYFRINTLNGIISFKTVLKINKEDKLIIKNYGFTFNFEKASEFSMNIKKDAYKKAKTYSSNIISSRKSRACTNKKGSGFYTDCTDFDVIVID